VRKASIEDHCRDRCRPGALGDRRSSLGTDSDLRSKCSGDRGSIRHLEAGGMRALMYEGHAHFYNIGSYDHAAVLDALEEVARDARMIPSAGPDSGALAERAASEK
jgi:hypothetical protein